MDSLKEFWAFVDGARIRRNQDARAAKSNAAWLIHWLNDWGRGKIPRSVAELMGEAKDIRTLGSKDALKSLLAKSDQARKRRKGRP
jgi:hypothetical protein